jgi:hypothetical protein
VIGVEKPGGHLCFHHWWMKHNDRSRETETTSSLPIPSSWFGRDLSLSLSPTIYLSFSFCHSRHIIKT